jgi:hypothetical protein
MLSGLYSVRFSAGGSNWGTGVVAFHDGKAHGGDASYYYMGTVEELGGEVRARIHVGHHTGERRSIFGPLNEFDLEVSGQPGGDNFTLNGHVVGHDNMKIGITGRKIADL